MATLNDTAASLARLERMSAIQLRSLLTQDPRQAAAWVAAAAEQGLPEAQVRLGRMLLEGQGIPKDEATALAWFQKAAEQGDAEAMNMQGRCYENGWGTLADFAQAAGCFLLAAQSGHAWAQYNLGHLFLNGQGVKQDFDQAFYWYGMAAQQGHARAMNLVGHCYEQGWSVACDPGRAAAWYRRSAEGGYARGQYNWASCLAQCGQLNEAAHWYKQAAHHGTQGVRHAVAQTLLSSRHPSFHLLALHVLNWCCERAGTADDFYRYGLALLQGYVGPPDRQHSMAWLGKAARLGHARAKEELIALGAEPEAEHNTRPNWRHRLQRMISAG